MPLPVSAIVENPPENSSIGFDAVARIESLPDYGVNKNNWGSNASHVFVKLAKKSNQQLAENKLVPFVEKYYPEQLAQLKNEHPEIKETSELLRLNLINIRNIHFSGQKGAPLGLIYALIGLGAFILLIAMLNLISAKYKEVAPEMPFSYSFLDASFDSMYRQERRVGKVALTFGLLAVLIACLGLFGLATYIAEQRTKEIGIRKVLGASVTTIVAMLSRDFIKLVLVSFVIAVPIAWWAMDRWLQDFAFRIDLSWGVFAATGLAALLIALLTLSFRAIRAAMANPVKSLRTE